MGYLGSSAFAGVKAGSSDISKIYVGSTLAWSSGPTDPSVSLLLHADGTNGSTTFIDDGVNSLPVTAFGNAKISNARSKFGGTSALFDGSGDYLSIPDSDGFDFGSGNFTIEAWVFPTSATGTGTIVSQKSSAGSVSSWRFGFSTTAGGLQFSYSTSGTGSSSINRPHNITFDTWQHWAACRVGGSLFMYVNGASLGSGLMSGAIYTSTEPVLVGAQQTSSIGTYLNGNIDELRISKGVARYTSAFTAPDAPFPNP